MAAEGGIKDGTEEGSEEGRKEGRRNVQCGEEQDGSA